MNFVLLYKHITNQLPDVFTSYFITLNKVHTYQTRNNNAHTIPKVRTDFAYKTIKTTGPIKWNSLQKDIKTAKSIKNFRVTIKDHMILNYI